MKILMLANHLDYGGITAYLLSLCRFLEGREGFKIYAASRGGAVEGEFRRLGVEHIRVPLRTKCEVSPKVFFAFFKLIRVIRREGIDLIHANTRVTQVLAALLSFFSGKPYVSTCHGFFKMRFFRKILPCWGQKVIAISDQVADHLGNDFHLDAERIVLIYNGVDVERFDAARREAGSLTHNHKQALGLDPVKKIVGHIGRLSSVKGQKYFILAARQLLKKRQDIQFLIVGDGPEEADLRRMIHEYRLEKDVLMRPSVSDTAPALSVMDVFVMPSIQEGLGISILEAQASGAAVVASNVGGIPAIVKDGQTGLLCEAKDVVSLTRAIEALLDNNSLREFVISQAKAQVIEKFSAGFMAEKTKRFYKSFYSISRGADV